MALTGQSGLHDLLSALPYHLFHDKVASLLHPADVHSFRSACKAARDYTNELAAVRLAKANLTPTRDVRIMARHTPDGATELGVMMNLLVNTKEVQPSLIDNLQTHVADFDISHDQETLDMSVWVSISSRAVHFAATEALHWDIYTDAAIEIWDELSASLRFVLLSTARKRLEQTDSEVGLAAFRPGTSWKLRCAVALDMAIAQLRGIHEMQLGNVMLSERMASRNAAPCNQSGSVTLCTFNSRASYSSSCDSFYLYGKDLAGICIEIKVHSQFYSVSVIVLLNGHVLIRPCSGENKPSLSGQRVVKDLDPSDIDYIMNWAQLKLETTSARLVDVPREESEPGKADISFFMSRARAALSEHLGSD